MTLASVSVVSVDLFDQHLDNKLAQILAKELTNILNNRLTKMLANNLTKHLTNKLTCLRQVASKKGLANFLANVLAQGWARCGTQDGAQELGRYCLIQLITL